MTTNTTTITAAGEPAELRFTAPVEIRGAADKPGRLSIVAYAGGVMTVEGFGPVVIDLAGMERPASIPILGDHDNSLDSIIGSGAPAVERGRLVVNAVLANSAAANQVRDLLASGVALQASVGVSPVDRQFIREGESVTANGRTHKAGPRGLNFVAKSVLKETSVVALGADANTSVSLAARRGGKRVIAMDFEAWLTANGFDPANVTAAQRPALMAAYQRESGESQHLRELRTATIEDDRIEAREIVARRYKSKHPEKAVELDNILELAHRDNWSPTECELHMMRASRLTARDLNGGGFLGQRGTSRHPSGGYMNPTNDTLVEAAILLRMGRADLAARHCGEQVTSAAEAMRCRSMMDIVEMAIRADGRDVPRGDNAMIKAGFSTLALPTALGNTAHKIALDAYSTTPATWRGFCKPVTVQNFKEHTLIRPHWLAAFQTITPGGELKHGTASESAYSISATTEGILYRVTRTDIVNDDLGLFESLSQGIGIASAEAISDAVWTKVLANASSFFGSGNGNYLSGATSALSIESLGAAIKLMRKMTGPTGKPISITPTTLVVGPELEMTARAILNSTLVARDTSSDDLLPAGNPIPNLNLLVEPRISNSTFSGYSLTKWYLFGPPTAGCVSVAFLNGQQNPVIETVDLESNVLGIGLRGYHDAGCALHDYKAGILSAGA